MLKQNTPDYKRLDDDEWYDEIHISVVPRYKTSGLSGDEWRVSAKIEIFRKGILLKERSFSKMHYAADFLPAVLHEMSDEGFMGSHEQFERLCFQPGCKDAGVVEYQLKDERLYPYGIKAEKQAWRQDVRRRFCERHALRGDCGLEDADSNYVLISAPPNWKGNAELGAAEAESPSARMDVQIDNIEDLPKAINKARKLHDKGEGG